VEFEGAEDGIERTFSIGEDKSESRERNHTKNTIGEGPSTALLGGCQKPF
jgi:hypothetical protein